MRHRHEPYAGFVAGQTRFGNESAVLVPVKAFARAKGRLGTSLSPTQRAALAQQMADRVVSTQGANPVFVCCDDDQVASWARAAGAEIVWCPGTDLNGAVGAGFAQLRTAGFRDAIVTHSDLPLISPLAWLGGWCGVTIVPDRHRTGTNVMVVPTTVPFTFAYGSGSFSDHVAEAIRHQCGLRIVHDSTLGWDVDHPDDLLLPDGSSLAPSPQ